MNKNKISVIVCAYNVQNYVQKCLNSLLNQTYKPLEIIVVEDGSTDSTWEILKSYQKNPQIQLYQNSENKGLSYSRNYALTKCSGQYIGYIDADDYVEENYYEKLMESIESEHSDVAVCDMKLYYEDTNTFQISRGCTKEESPLCFINTGLCASACNKLFKKEQLQAIPFEEGKVNEDIAVIIPILVQAKKVSYVEGTYYYYVQRQNSLQNSTFSEKRFDIFFGVEQTLERIKGCLNYENISSAIIYHQLIAMLLFVFPKMEDAKVRKQSLKKYSELSKPYSYSTNPYYTEYINTLDRKRKTFFQTLVYAVEHQKPTLANLLISTLQTLQNHVQRSVIQELDEETIIRLAKENQMYEQKIKISVVIPNYNYANFLEERLYSILSQKVKLYEIILLDDHSQDQSVQKIQHYEKILSPYIPVKTKLNQKNSGSAFKQWQVGFELAQGDYVWIAEADDYCHEEMLKELIKPILKENNIYISYCDTAFINQTGRIILPSIKKEIDIQRTHHWDKNYINSGEDELRNYTFLNCTIANVSSTLIKKDDYTEYFKLSSAYKQAGDWLFYANVMRRGKIAYCKKAYNYYRMHGNNVSSTFKKEQHLLEIKKIHAYFDSQIHLNETQKQWIEKRYEFLQEAWNLEGEK